MSKCTWCGKLITFIASPYRSDTDRIHIYCKKIKERMK